MKSLATFVLERGTENFIEELKAKNSPPIYQLSPIEARAVLEQLQANPNRQSNVQIENRKIPFSRGDYTIKIVRPKNNNSQILPTVIFCHGAGWVMGSFNTHARLICDLTLGTQAAFVFVEYALSPEAKFPIPIEQAYNAMEYVIEHAKELKLDISTLSIVGDSVGGNMASVLTMLAKERNGPKIKQQVLFYPVTSSELNTPSYHIFADGPWLTKPAMEWFWNSYEPDHAARRNPLLSPLNARIEQLKGLPKALIITAENDVLRDEGEEYAHKLLQAGVNVTATRFLGTIHDFVMLNRLAETPAAIEAKALVCQFLLQGFNSI